MAEKSYTPEYLGYLERRYVDLKQIFEAVISYYPPDAYEENHLFETIVCEFNYLADILGYEDEGQMLDRLLRNDEESEDELDDFDDEED